MLPVWPIHRQPHRTELRFDARAVFLRRVDRGLPRGPVGDRLELAILGDAIEVGETGALHGERLLSGIAGSVVAHELVGALAQGVVGVVGLPLDDRGAFFHLARRGSERPLDGFVRSLRLGAWCDCDDTEDEQNYAFHFADPPCIVHACAAPEPRCGDVRGAYVSSNRGRLLRRKGRVRGSACTRRSAPDEGLPLVGRKRLHVFFSKNLSVSLEPTLDFVTSSNAFASLLTSTLGVDRSKPCGPSSPELRVRLARQRRDKSSCENSSQVADQSASHSRTFE